MDAGPNRFVGIEEVVVLARAVPALIFEKSPIEKQIIDRERIEALPNLNAADVVAKLPGIRATQLIQGQQAAVSIEGLPPEYTKVLVNGQRYTGFVGSIADLTDVPLTNIDRMEILRGAQGLKHGPDAGAGVIDIVTRPMGDDPVRADVWGVAGSDDRYLLATTVGARGGPVGTTLSFTHDEIAGYEPRGSSAVFVGIGGRESRFATDDFYMSQEYGVEGPVSGFARFGYREEGDRYVSSTSGLVGENQLKRWLGTTGATARINDEVRVDSALTYYQASQKNDIARTTEIVDRELRGELSASYERDLSWTSLALTAGVDIRELIYDLEEAPLPFTPPPDVPALSGDREFQELATTGGGFAELEARPANWLTFSAGLRVQLDTRFDVMPAPQVGILFEPTDWLGLRFQYGRSDRYPSLNDLHQPVVAQLGGQYYLGGNPDLVPEKTDSYRAGFEIDLGESFSFTTTGYWNEIDGLIRHAFAGSIQVGENIVYVSGNPPAICLRLPPDYVLYPFCNPAPVPVVSPVKSDLFLKRNLEFVRTRGVQAQLQWQPIERVTLRGGYTYMETRIESKILPDLKELPNEPTHTVDLETRFTFPSPAPWLGEPQFSAIGRHRSAALGETSGTGLAGFTSNQSTSSSWVVDLRLNLPIVDLFMLNFDVRNLTNERTVDSYEIRGRVYAMGLRMRWPT